MKEFGKILWGFVFIILGIIFGCNALGITDINVFFDGWWTLFIIVPCAIGLFTETEKTGNIIGVVIGILLFLSCSDIMDFSVVWKLIVPIVLIGIGVSFIFRDLFTSKVRNEIKKINSNNNDNEENATFSSKKLSYNGEEFKGVTLNAVFGGIKCDLTNAKIKKDQVINVTSIFGGVDIIVPKDVKVKVNSTAVFGGVDDKSIKSEEKNSKIIYVNAKCVFGGVEIK